MKRRGLAILETVLAILLLGLVLGALFNFLPMSLLTTDRAGHRMQAQALADSGLERLHSQPFAELATGTTISKCKVARMDYEVTLQIFTIPGHDPTRIKGLRSLVKWSDRIGPAQVENELWISCVTQ